VPVRLLAASLAVALTVAIHASSDPFAPLAPTVQLSQDDRRQLDQRQIVVKILPAEDRELAVVAAGALNTSPDALLSSVRRIADLKRSRYVPQIHRISAAPALDDFRELTLDNVDRREIASCRADRPDDCDLKLTADEIVRLTAAGSNVDEEFRRVLVRRAQQYLAEGQRMGDREFTSLLQHSRYLHQHLPELAGHLARYPALEAAGSESFLYWSKEEYAWKPMITITHVTMMRGDGRRNWPDVVVAARDIFSTRYTSASLTLTLLVHDDGDPSRRYLVYLNRTWVDSVRALWRPFVEHRIRGQARNVFAEARDRIERGAVTTTAQR